MEVKEKDFFTQTLKVGSIVAHSWDYCDALCVDKKVLHIGCSDWPIFHKDSNLHIHLSEIAKELHGVDPNGIEELKEHFDGTYFQTIYHVSHKHINSDYIYDVILAPNILEHLTNPGAMVNELFSVKFKKLFVLVPNYKVYEQSTYKDDVFTERVHPDHYCWYSPYTLYNLFKQQIENGGYKYEMNFFDNQNMISILITKE